VKATKVKIEVCQCVFSMKTFHAKPPVKAVKMLFKIGKCNLYNLNKNLEKNYHIIIYLFQKETI